MATLALILAEFRTAVAAVNTTRFPTVPFLEAATDEAFRNPPLYTKERFLVEPGALSRTAAFGKAGLRMNESEVRVLLGHPPVDPSATTVDYIAADGERLADILEDRTWSTSGVDGVFFESRTIERADANWVVSALTYRVLYTGASLT